VRGTTWFEILVCTCVLFDVATGYSYLGTIIAVVTNVTMVANVTTVAFVTAVTNIYMVTIVTLLPQLLW
jgi:hypothetical protein